MDFLGEEIRLFCTVSVIVLKCFMSRSTKITIIFKSEF